MLIPTRFVRARHLAITALAGGAAVAGAVAMTMPASAHDGTHRPLAACTATTPVNTPCTPTVTAPTTTGGDYTVTLPGVGTLNVTVDPTSGAITGASVSGLNASFTASTPTIDSDKDKASVTYTNTSTGKTYTVTTHVKPAATPGGTPTVTARARSGNDADRAGTCNGGMGSDSRTGYHHHHRGR